MRLSVLPTLAALSLGVLACQDEPLTGPEARAAFSEAVAHSEAAPQDLLVFVDGQRLPSGAGLNDLDPTQIARIEVLKGAAARQVYGDAARHGVVHIYTLQGLRSDLTTGGR